MASAVAAGPLQPNARPPSTLDTLFDVLGNAAGRFDQLTGARINAHALNAATTALIREPLHAVDETNERARDAYSRGRNAAYLATHPRAAVHALDTALRKSGHGSQLDNFYNGAGMAYYYGRKGFGAAKDFYKRSDALMNGKYPAQGTWIEKAAWDANRAFGAIKGFIDDKDKLKTAGRFAGDHWATVRKYLKKHDPRLLQTYHEWKPMILGAGRDFFKGVKYLSHKYPLTSRILMKASEYGGRLGGAIGTVSGWADKAMSPIMAGVDMYNLYKDVTAKKRDWWKTAGDAGKGVWDTYSAFTAWGKKPLTWFFNKTRLGQKLANTGIRLGKQYAMPLAEKYVFPLGRRYVTPLLDRIATRLGGRAGMQVMERAALQSLERAGIQAGEKAGPRLLSNPYVATAAAAIGLGAGGVYAYRHPKERKQFLRNAGDFFHNVGIGLHGTPKEKARSGWHPWADYVSSMLNLGGDLATLHLKKASQDASSWKHAVNKVAGLEPPPGGRAMRPQDIWQNKTFRFINDDLMPALDPLGISPHMDVDQMKSTSEWLQSHLHAAAPRSRPSTQLRAPSSGRSPQPHRQGAGNTPTKTQAEIRVRFDNLPSGKRIDTRAAGSSALAETGAQFAF